LISSLLDVGKVTSATTDIAEGVAVTWTEVITREAFAPAAQICGNGAAE